MAFVVDTNVAVVANGREDETNVDANCRLTCMERLRVLSDGDVVAIDDRGLILREYANRLSFSGMPGVGDAFFKHIFDHQYQNEHVRRVAVTPCDDERRGFVDLPENTL